MRACMPLFDPGRSLTVLDAGGSLGHGSKSEGSMFHYPVFLCTEYHAQVILGENTHVRDSEDWSLKCVIICLNERKKGNWTNETFFHRGYFFF